MLIPDKVRALQGRASSWLRGMAAHVRFSGPVLWMRRRPRVAAALAVGAIALAAGGAALAMEWPPAWGPFAPRSVADHRAQARENPRDADVQRDLGHAEWRAGRRAAALAAYERALKLHLGAADDELVRNVVACFGHKEQPKAEALVKRFRLAQAENGLEKLAGSKRYAVRWGAVRTLDAIGKASRTDWVNAYVADLDSADCDVRRRAVEKLGAIGDRGALAALRKADKADAKTGGWFRSGCLGDRPERAEKQILARR